jgi:hypothetical protein
MTNKFPVLSGVQNLLRVAGWLVIIAGVLYAVYEGIIEPHQPGHAFGGGDVVEIAIGMILAVGGLIVVAFSEVMGVLLAIEENTRAKSATNTTEVQVKEKPGPYPIPS